MRALWCFVLLGLAMIATAQTAARQEHFERLVLGYRAQGREAEMQRTAVAMMNDDPDGRGSYWVAALAVSGRETSPAGLALAAKAARHLVDRRDPHLIAAGRRTLGWIALQDSNWTQAETEFRLALLNDAGDAESAFWLGASLLNQGRAEDLSEAMGALNRALKITGAGELTGSERFIVRKTLDLAFARSRQPYQRRPR